MSERLLLCAATSEGGRAVEAWEEWQAANDLDAVDEACFRLLPCVYHNLQSISPYISKHHRLRGIYRHTWSQNQLTLQHLAVTLEALRKSGVPVLVHRTLGVAALRGTLVGAAPVRSIDLLVDADNIPSAHGVLHALAWNPVKGIPPPLLRRLPGRVAYDHARCGRLNVHWHPYTVPCAKVVERAVWRRSIQSVLEYRAVSRPDHVDLMLATCLHDRRLDATGRLVWLTDAVAILRSREPIDWEQVRARAIQAELLQPVAAAMRHLHETLGIEVPSSLRSDPVRSRRAWEAHRFAALHGEPDDHPNTLRQRLAEAWAKYKVSSADAKRHRPLGFLPFLAEYYQYEWDLKHRWLSPIMAGQKLLKRLVRPSRLQ